jgi:hypothetical protein
MSSPPDYRRVAIQITTQKTSKKQRLGMKKKA